MAIIISLVWLHNNGIKRLRDTIMFLKGRKLDEISIELGCVIANKLRRVGHLV